jgi:hypothetical protein
METKKATSADITLPARVSIPSEVIFQTLHEECVLLNMASETYYGLDEVGARMWQLLAEYGETATVLAHLRAHYDADEATLRRDLAALIEKLSAEGLISIQQS